jgi:hypothetical protein
MGAKPAVTQMSEVVVGSVLGSRVEGWLLAGKPSNSHFERERWWWWMPHALRARERLVVGTNPLQHSRFEWEGVSWQENPPTRVSSEGGVVLSGQVGGGGHKSPLYPNREWRGGCWQGNPPTRVSSRGGGGGGCHLRFERGRGWWWARIPSVTQIASGGGGAWQKPRQLALRARERVGMCRVCVSAAVIKKEHNEEGITPSLCRNL